MSKHGYTLIEILLTIALLALLSGITIPLVRDSTNAGRYEATREKMTALRDALIGTSAVDSSGTRTNFGYVGDWGALPAALGDLTSAKSPAWAMSTALGIGAGWRGPYISERAAGPEGVNKDKWGFTFVYNTAANPPTLTSLGADNKAGGAIYDADLVMLLNTAGWKSTVQGFVMRQNTPQSSKTVQLAYPSSGAFVTQNSITDANGAFSFTNIPYGLRAVTVTGSPQLGPRPVTIESPYQVISGGLLNYFDRTERVTYVPGSFSAPGTGGTVFIRLDNTYPLARTIDFLNHFVDRDATTTEGFLKRVALRGVAQLISPGLSSNSRIDITANLVLPANSTNNTFELSFTTTAGGSTARDMSIARFTEVFEWANDKRQDSVTYP